MSLIAYVIQKLEVRIGRLEKKQENSVAEIEGRLDAIEECYVDVNYLKAVIEKVQPEAEREGWWQDIVV